MKPISLYVDASVGKKVVGLGVFLSGTGVHVSLGTGTKPGCSVTEAEILAAFFGLDVFRAYMDNLKTQNPTARTAIAKNVRLTVFTDSLALIRATHGIGTVRSEATRILAKNLVNELDGGVTKIYKEWSIEPIRTGENPADRIATEARKRWIARWRKPKPKSSGRS